MLDEFDETAALQGLCQDNEHRAAWLDINHITLVRHGWWRQFGDKYRCSVCCGDTTEQTPFCARCGSTMRAAR